MIAAADLDRLLAEIKTANMIEGWMERNGIDPEIIGWIKGMADSGLVSLVEYSIKEMIMAKLEEDEDLAEEGSGIAIIKGHSLMEPIVQTIAVCFFQLGWEAHKQYGRSPIEF